MDMLRLMTVVRRHWLLMTLGVIAGIFTMVSAMFQVVPTPSGSTLEPRSYTTYQVDMQLIVTDPLYGLGRAPRDANDQTPDSFDKTITLAQTYANLLLSDSVRAAADAKAGVFKGDIVSQGIQYSPIITVTMKGTDAKRMERYGTALAGALAQYLSDEQAAHGIPKENRVAVKMLASPNRPKEESSRKWEMAGIAFLTPIAAAYGFALLRERPRLPKATAAGTDGRVA